MNAIRKAWHSASLNTRIALLFLAIAAASSLVIGLTSYRLSSNAITQASIEESRNNTKAVAVTIDSFFRAADQAFIGVYSGRELAEALKPGGMRSEYAESLRRGVQSAILNARQINSSILYINIYGVNGFSYTDSYYHSEENRGFDECVEYYGGFGLTDERRNALWVPDQTIQISNTNRRTVTLVRYIRDYYSLEIRGIMAMGLSESNLSRQYQSVDSDVYIADRSGMIVSQYDKSMIGAALPYPELTGMLSSGAGLDTLSFDGEDGARLFAAYSVIPATGWYVVSVVDRYNAFIDSYNLSYYIIAILLMTMVVSGIVLVLVSRALTASTDRLILTMKQAMAGDLSVRYEASGNDEVNKIGKYLNDMLGDIEESLLFREQSEKVARAAELKLLQSQINPHLLYNSLDSILYHLERGRLEGAAEILKSMSAFFKLSLSQGEFLIPIEKEISLIRNYLDIQRMCRDKDIELSLTGDTASLLSLRVPKMMLQPIVENSILHGFEGDIVHGAIKIDLAESEGAIIISVEDNGSGLMQDEAEGINAGIQAPHSGFDQKHYGLWNNNQRIKDAFGPESGLLVESEFGVFTRVVITLRIQQN